MLVDDFAPVVGINDGSAAVGKVTGCVIRGITDDRASVPKKKSVICHHLNYFFA